VLTPLESAHIRSAGLSGARQKGKAASGLLFFQIAPSNYEVDGDAGLLQNNYFMKDLSILARLIRRITEERHLV